MGELLGDFVLPLAGLAVLLVIATLYSIARLHPLLSLVMGLAFLAVPVVQLVTFKRSDFQSEGSAAGLVFFMVYAVVGLGCASLGMTFAAQGVSRLARGEVVSQWQRRAAIGVTVALGLALIGWQAWRIHYAPPPATRQAVTLSTFDAEVKRVVKVQDSYPLAWKRRDGAPKLSLAIPAIDLVPEVGAVPSIGETNDGPESVALRVPLAGSPRLTLRRGESFVDERALAWLDANVAPADPGLPRALWIDTRGGGWSLLGLDCGPETAARYPALGKDLACFVPEDPLARWVPAPFRMERVRLHVADDRQPARCTVTFRFHGRLVDIKGDGPCFDAANGEALRASVALLDRLSRDTQAPPNAQARFARAAEAVKRCEAAPARAPTQAESVPCEQAASLAAATLREQPLEGSRLVLRALDAQGPHTGRATARRHQDAVLGALQAAGQGQSREALWAHALRLAHLEGSAANAGEAQAAKASFDMLASQVPVRLTADDPLFDKAYFAMGRVRGDEARDAEIEFIKAWRAKAGNPGPETDLGLKLRYHLCRALMSANRERETLGACADELMAGWQARAASGGGFGMVNGEPELAAAIARMYYSHGFASQDFAAGEAGVRRVREMAAGRIPAQPARDQLDAMFLDLEAQLAAKAPPPRRSR
jgi:hypothetical protein